MHHNFSIFKALVQEKSVLEFEIANALDKNKTDVVRQVRLQNSTQLPDRNAAKKTQNVNSKNARYRNPSTGETWSGLGRLPRWIEGRDRKPFEI